MTTSIEETLAQLRRFASTTELDEREAHSEATRLAEVAVEARKYAAASEADANEAFDKMGRLSDRAEAALEAFEAYRESTKSDEIPT